MRGYILLGFILIVSLSSVNAGVDLGGTSITINNFLNATSIDTWFGNYSLYLNTTSGYNQSQIDANRDGNDSGGGFDTWLGNYTFYFNASTGYNQTNLDAIITGNVSGGSDTFNGNYSSVLNTTSGQNTTQIDGNILGNVTGDGVGNNATFVGANYSTNLNTSNGYNQTNIDAIVTGNVSGDGVGNNATFVGANYSDNVNASNIETYGYYNSSLTNSSWFEDVTGTLSIIWDSIVNVVNNVTYNKTTIDSNILGNGSAGGGNTTAEIQAVEADPNWLANASFYLNFTSGQNTTQVDANILGNVTGDGVGNNATFVGANYSSNLNNSNGQNNTQIDGNILGNSSADGVGNNATFVGANYTTNLNITTGYNQTNLDAIISGNVSAAGNPFDQVLNTTSEVDFIKLDITTTFARAMSIISDNDSISSTPYNLVLIQNMNTSWARPLLRINDNSTDGGASSIRMDGANPDIEFIETDQTFPNGKWELAVNGNDFQINSRNDADNSFETIMDFDQLRQKDDGGHVRLNYNLNVTDGNVTALFYFGDGSQLTNLPAGTETDPVWAGNYSFVLNITSGQNTTQIDGNILGNSSADGVGNNATFVGANYSTNLNTSNGYNQTNIDAIIVGNISATDTNLSGIENINNSINGWYPSLFVNGTWLNESIDAKIASITYNATNITTNAGTYDEGVLADILTANDGKSYNISEDAGSPALTLVINFTGVDTFNSILMREWYVGGAGHEIEVGAYNPTGGTYEEEYGDITDMAGFAFTLRDVFDPADHITTDGNVSIQLRHEQNGIASHDFFLDYIVLVNGFNTITSTDHDSLSGRDNDNNHPQYANKTATDANILGNSTSGGNSTADIINAINNTEGVFNITVNLSDYWDANNLTNSTQFETEADGTLSLLWSWFSSTFDTLFGTKTTDDLAEGSSNIYEQFNWNGNKSDYLNFTSGQNATQIDANILGNGTADGVGNNATFVGANYTTNLNITTGYNQTNLDAIIVGNMTLDTVGQNATFIGANYSTNINDTNFHTTNETYALINISNVGTFNTTGDIATEANVVINQSSAFCLIDTCLSNITNNGTHSIWN